MGIVFHIASIAIVTAFFIFIVAASLGWIPAIGSKNEPRDRGSKTLADT